MIPILRNCTITVVTALLAGANAYWSFINPYLACALALLFGFLAGRLVEQFFIKRAHGDMKKEFGEDWVK